MDINSFLLGGFPAIALVMVLVKIARVSGLNSKYAPALSLGLGNVAGIAMAYQNGTPLVTGIAVGIAIGASACGLYDASKYEESEKAVV